MMAFNLDSLSQIHLLGYAKDDSLTVLSHTDDCRQTKARSSHKKGLGCTWLETVNIFTLALTELIQHSTIPSEWAVVLCNLQQVECGRKYCPKDMLLSCKFYRWNVRVSCFCRLCNVGSLSGMSRILNGPYLRCDTCIWGLNRIRKSFRCYQNPLVVIYSGWGCCLVMVGNSLQLFWKNLHNSDTYLQLVRLKTFVFIFQKDLSRVTA